MSFVRRDRTKAVANMLSENKQVDEMRFDPYTFDQALRYSHVAPRLECNLYRKRFVTLRNIEEPKTRAAIVATASARVARNPSLVLMVLSQSHDVLTLTP
jgi:hypothetical protein